MGTRAAGECFHSFFETDSESKPLVMLTECFGLDKLSDLRMERSLDSNTFDQ